MNRFDLSFQLGFCAACGAVPASQGKSRREDRAFFLPRKGLLGSQQEPVGSFNKGKEGLEGQTPHSLSEKRLLMYLPNDKDSSKSKTT